MGDIDVHQLTKLLSKELQPMLLGKSTLKEAMEFTDQKFDAVLAYSIDLAKAENWHDSLVLLNGLEIIDPQSSQVHSCLGSVYMRVKMYDLALSELLYALSLNENDATAHTNAGELYLMKGNINFSMQHFKRSIELEPEGPAGLRARLLITSAATAIKEIQTKGPQAIEELRKELRSE